MKHEPFRIWPDPNPNKPPEAKQKLIWFKNGSCARFMSDLDKTLLKGIPADFIVICEPEEENE